MNLLLKLLSAVGLGLTVFPSFFVYSGSITWNMHAGLMIIGTILWFVTAPFWMLDVRFGKQRRSA